MIRPSDKGPGKARPPRVKAGGRSGGTPPASGETKSWWSCGSVIALPAACVLAMFLIASGVVR